MVTAAPFLLVPLAAPGQVKRVCKPAVHGRVTRHAHHNQRLVLKQHRTLLLDAWLPACHKARCAAHTVHVNPHTVDVCTQVVHR